MKRIGYDCGTYNLVCCHRDDKNNFVHKREVNAFLEMPLENRFVFNMMKNAGVPLIERDDVAYALGESAVEMAYTMSHIELKRPMCDGCVNPKEKDAFQIMSIMMHSLLGDIKADKTPLYYSVPANAINQETDADYHGKILQSIFNAYRSKDGYTVDAHPINEALAIVYAEAAQKAFTAIAISAGGGMVNVCFSIFGSPVFTFAIVNSGDWIDRMAAKATGESIAYINREKTKIDLSKAPTNLVERAIQTQYQLMIEKTVQGIKKGIIDAGNKARTDKPIDVIVAGGTASPTGFDVMFSEVLHQAELPIKIGNVIRPADPLYSVCRGCLIAAENASH
jgi:hypothetical protein